MGIFKKQDGDVLETPKAFTQENIEECSELLLDLMTKKKDGFFMVLEKKSDDGEAVAVGGMGAINNMNKFTIMTAVTRTLQMGPQEMLDFVRRSMEVNQN
jgi:hypothetical protein